MKAVRDALWRVAAGTTRAHRGLRLAVLVAVAVLTARAMLHFLM